jgi:hypothetical protein
MNLLNGNYILYGFAYWIYIFNVVGVLVVSYSSSLCPAHIYVYNKLNDTSIYSIQFLIMQCVQYNQHVVWRYEDP